MALMGSRLLTEVKRQREARAQRQVLTYHAQASLEDTRLIREDGSAERPRHLGRAGCTMGGRPSNV